MEIVIHCTGIPFNGDTIKKQSLGGSESAAYYIAKELANNHDVTIFTNSKEEGVFDNVKYVYAGELTQEFPLGNRFEFYARNTPHDVLIIQRHPQAFIKPFASKVNILWLHDLALYRNKDIFLSQMWNVDAVFTVSQYHKDQVCKVYGLKQNFVYPVLNGVDLDFINSSTSSNADTTLVKIVEKLKSDGKELLVYSSRPERGLNNLVDPDGIMEKLQTESPNLHLIVCGYENTTPHMAEYYNYLWNRCDELENVVNVGALDKHSLAYLMKEACLHVYPTEFEEVSCITAMEAAAAGNPLISSNFGALPETCNGGGAVLIPLDNGKVDRDRFIKRMLEVLGDNVHYHCLVTRQLDKVRSTYSWSNGGSVFKNAIINTIVNRVDSSESIVKHLLNRSDIVFLDSIINDCEPSPIIDSVKSELEECYQFYYNDTYKEHYQSYYEYEERRGVNYGPEDLSNNLRFQHVCNIMYNVPDNSTVLDYGCAHGHYTINLAKKFPKVKFIGIDIEETNIIKAKQWAKDENLNNVEFYQGEASSLKDKYKVDILIVAEVLEHVGNIDLFLLDVLTFLKVGGKAIFTTPYGPWEAIGYREHWPFRAHLYEFDKADIKNIFGNFEDFQINYVPSGFSNTGESIGSYVYSFTKNSNKTILQRYEKTGLALPNRQTLSLCMIVYNAEHDIGRCLNSALPICDELVIGLDKRTTDDTRRVIESIVSKIPNLAFKLIHIDSPIDIGFDDARNLVIDEASADWIMWLDSDEELHNPQGILPYLRNSQYDGISMRQHHITAMPAGVLKTDIPCKIFRNNIGIKFYGVVHEHPERIYGEGIEYVCGISQSNIMHYGYPNEVVRRNRFKRNLELLKRDREKYPDRTLGKMLYLRDLSQMNKFQIEAGLMNDSVIDRANEAIELWRDILDENLRMAIEGLQFYSECVRLLGSGFEYEMTINIDKEKLNGSVDTISARFFNEEHAKILQTKLLDDKVNKYVSKYY